MRRVFGALGSEQFLGLYLPAFILALGIGIAAPALPTFAKTFDVSFGVASLVIVAHLAGSMAGTVPTGYLIDRVGRRKVMLAGPVLTAVATLLVARAESFPELLAYRFLAGWATQMWTLARLTMISDSGGGRRARQVTSMIAMDMTGRLAGPALGGFLAATIDVRAPFVVHGLLALLAIIPSFYLGRGVAARAETARVAATGGQPAGRRLTLAELLTGTALLLFLSQLLANVTRGVIFNGTLLFYAAYAYNVAPDELGYIAAITGVTGVPMAFLMGHLMDRFGRRATIIPGQTLLGVTFGLMAITAFVHSPFPLFVVALALVQFAQSVTFGSMQTLGTDVAPPHARGQFLGVWRLMAEIGSLLSPSLFAVVAEVAGYGWAFLVPGVAGVLTAVLVATQVTETLRRAPPSSTPPTQQVAHAGGAERAAR